MKLSDEMRGSLDEARAYADSVAQLEDENERLKESLKHPQGCGMDGCLFQKYNMDFTRR